MHTALPEVPLHQLYDGESQMGLLFAHHNSFMATSLSCPMGHCIFEKLGQRTQEAMSVRQVMLLEQIREQ